MNFLIPLVLFLFWCSHPLRFQGRNTIMVTAVHIWIVRESLVEKVCQRWNLEFVEIIHVEVENSFEKLKTVLKKGVNL
jgi:nicotinate-nucleotide pyrophosphorylase